MSDSELREAVLKLAEVAPKLLHETGRLHRDVAKLSANVFRDPEISYTYGSRDYDPPPRKMWPVPDALNMIDEARKRIIDCERELSAIQSKLNQILWNEASREEFKQYLKDS